MKKTLFFVLITISFFICNSAHAQLVSGNIYLPGAWVEVGIAPNGSWGGQAGAGAAPAGYHPAPTFTYIGSMYDWGHDGWAIGTPPYFGDYMLEGTPFEGWSMQVNGARNDAFYTTNAGWTGTGFYNQTPAVSSLTGANTSYTDIGGVITGVWQGTATGTSSTTITQTTTLDTFASWVINRVVITNTSGAAIPGVYYWRTFDPDGDESWSSNFATNNAVVYQNDALHRVMVNSTGMMYSQAYLSLSAKDCRAVCMVYQNWAPYPAYGAGNSLDKVWAGTATGIAPDDYVAGSPYNGDYAIGIVFNLGTIAAGDSAVFSYAYIYDGNIGIDSAFPESVITGPTSLCVGSTITLSDPAIGGTWASSNSSVATIAPYTGIVGGVTPGTVIITYTLDPATCRTAVTYTVTVTNGVPPITGLSTLCAGATDNLSDATPGGTWSVGNTSIATISPTGLLTGAAGTTNITYSIGGGCLATQSVSVGLSTPVISGNTNLCVGATTTLSGSPAGGTWSSGNTNVATVAPGSSVIHGVSAGTAIITYTTICAAATITVTVTSPPGPITTGVFYYPCTGYFSTISDATPGGTWSTSNSNIATVSSDTLYEGSLPGVSVVHYSNSCGTASFSQTVSSRPMTFPGIPTAIAAMALCIGSTITLSNDGTPVGTWSSSNTNIATINPVTGFLSSTGIAGSTLITATNFCGGENLTFNFSSPGAITGITTLCQGATTSLSDTVASGTWSSSAPGIATVIPNTGIVTGVNAGTAVITYTIPGGCFTTTTVTIEQSPNAISGNPNVCTGATTTLNDSPTGGTWSSSSGLAGIATISGTGVVSGVSAGTSIITYTLTGNCSATTTVTVYTSPTAISGTTSVCTGMSIPLSNGVSGGTWSSGTPAIATVTPNTGVVSGVNAGNVIITYTSGGNCITTTTVMVNITPTVTTGSPNICTDGTTLLTGTPAGGTWSTGSSSAATIHIGTGSDTVAGVFSGNTVITYTLAGCSASTTVTVVAVLPGITGPSSVCTGQTITLNNTVTGGTWSSANTSIATVYPSLGIVTGVAPGDTVISYTIGGSCITTATVMVNLSPNPGTITGPANLCVGGTIVLSDTSAGGVWSISNGDATLSGDSVTGVTPGMDTVMYTTSSLYCGTATTAAAVVIVTAPNAGAISGDTVVCFGATITLSDNAGGGSWSSSNRSIATISTAGMVHTVAVGLATISYTVTNACNTAIATYTVTVYPLPAISAITGQDSVCPGAVFMLSDATTDGVWTTSNTNISLNSTGQVHALTTGTSVITYTTGPNAGNCVSVRTFTVTVSANGNFTVSGAVNPVTCNGADNGSITITVGGDNSHIKYTWLNGDSTAAITNLAPNNYTVHVADTATQCTVSNTFTITQPDTLEVTGTTGDDTCENGTGFVTINVTGGTKPYTYSWSNGKTAKDIGGLPADTYTVTVVDSNGCTKSIAATVKEDSCYNVIIHDVLTPNGDGKNDTWIIEGLDRYPKNSVEVFDKWGDMIYSKTNYDNKWDGGHAPDGTYYYLVKLNAENQHGGKNVWTGSLLIKR